MCKFLHCSIALLSHMVVPAQAKGITGILNGVEDIVRPDNEDLGLDVLYDATSLEKKLECKATIQKATVRSTEATRACATPTLIVLFVLRSCLSRRLIIFLSRMYLFKLWPIRSRDLTEVGDRASLSARRPRSSSSWAAWTRRRAWTCSSRPWTPFSRAAPTLSSSSWARVSRSLRRYMLALPLFLHSLVRFRARSRN
jgi:hypothetical protein